MLSKYTGQFVKKSNLQIGTDSKSGEHLGEVRIDSGSKDISVEMTKWAS